MLDPVSSTVDDRYAGCVPGNVNGSFQITVVRTLMEVNSE